MAKDRERGFLSEDPDRQFLRGDKNYQTIQGKRDRQATIRQRLKDGIIDFSVTQQNLSEWNWHKFTDMERQAEMNFRSGMVAAIALFYEFHHAKGWDFSTTLRDGLEEAHKYGTHRQMPARIVDDVEFEPKTREPEKHRSIQERIEKKLEAGEDLTHHEKSVALETGGQLMARVREHIDERSQRNWAEKQNQKVEESIERHGKPDFDAE